MANFVYIENNQILEKYQNLPRGWRHVSGLNLLESQPEKLQELGWYRVQKQHQNYDTEVYKVSGFHYEIQQNGFVVETLELEQYSDQELDEKFNQIRKNFFERLRSGRNQKLQESDWTQILDVYESFDLETRAAWREYRKNLRDLPEQYQNLLDYTNLKIIWPEEPA
jgi:hypothetical protein